jgi:predicted enzyme related to lactoylglutathione lyase
MEATGGSYRFRAVPNNTNDFGNPNHTRMINFRVANLDCMIAQLRAKGIEVTLDLEIYPNGRFARLNDPERNPIELWEPKTDADGPNRLHRASPYH